VNDDEKEHADHVLEECAKKICKDVSSNLRIHATNAYLKAHSVVVNNFNYNSTTFLTVEQYASVSDSFLVISY
jgi:hypothetical protein